VTGEINSIASLDGSGLPLAAYDEFLDGSGNVRNHQQLLEEFLRAPGTDLSQVKRAIVERTAEQEVTFNILGVPEGTNRPWELDPTPLVLDHSEFSALSSGLTQRARLFELVLQDLYGPQSLLKRGLLPPRLVFENPHFWRGCHGWLPVGGSRLVLYAADVARNTDGRFVVYSDRTAAPTGSGYTLENRLVTGRVLPELFRRYSVLKLNRYFQAVRSALEHTSPRTSEEPRIVVFTPGMQDESSFEHAYLSRYLGYELVEGRDLTVRNGIVYLKTLSGLRQVDVIVRRVFDDYCDPLELRADSLLGVPGLVAAARAGTVAIANPLGSALVEAPAFKAYLPALARALLGEELALPSVKTFWCGDPAGLSETLARLDRVVLKPAFGDRRGDPLVLRNLGAKEREALIQRVEARPWQFVAEEWPDRSQVPTWTPTGIERGPVSLRTFLCRSGNDFEVMKGGLARVGSAPDGVFLSLGADRVSKDVWIPSPTPEPDLPLPSMPDRRVELRRGGIDLPSRLLDDLYWLGRYLERADNTVRLVRAGTERATDPASSPSGRVLEAICEALLRLEILEPQASSPGSEPPRPLEVHLFTALRGSSKTNNLLMTLRRVHTLTLRTRTRLSTDAWHALRQLLDSRGEVEAVRADDPADQTIDLLDRLLLHLGAVTGAMVDNMVRGQAWAFMDMGRRVERGAFVLTILKSLLPGGAVRAHMEALLQISDSLLTYRARYLSSLEAAPVVDLLLTDESNPRSLVYQVERMLELMARLPREATALKSQGEKRAISLHAELLTLDVERACAGDGAELRAALDRFLGLLWATSDEIAERFFSHAEVAPIALLPPSWIGEELESR
jgi:uncharacterized circularly permuted ATP-grasp superfamily protein/uncharacterized alpha-E superfamily protein